MQMRFLNKENCETSNPTEQKVFKKNGESGWVMAFSILTPMSSTELDEVLTENNISEITLSDGTNEKAIYGYDKITMVTVRYSDNITSVIDVQLSKGL